MISPVFTYKSLTLPWPKTGTDFGPYLDQTETFLHPVVNPETFIFSTVPFPVT